jgi:hypothetical protein
MTLGFRAGGAKLPSDALDSPERSPTRLEPNATSIGRPGVTLTRRDVVIGATAAVATAALPGVSMAASVKRGVVLSGSRELADAGAQVGDWYWDFPTRNVWQRTARGWDFLFNLEDRSRIPADAEIEELTALVEAAEVRRRVSYSEIEDPEWGFA